MKLLFISYWGINEGLTQATVLPHLEILSEMDVVESIDFVTIERNPFDKVIELPKKVRFTPIESRNIPINLLNKVSDIRLINRKLTRLIKKNKIDFIIGRNAVAGAICHKLHKKLNIPYAVESFEPHADYMLESRVWKPSDPRYIFQKRWEKMQKKSAELIMPVSHHYKKTLIDEGVSASKVEVMPCAVDLELFKFSEVERNRLRQKLNISKDAVVGIYVGKFGGIYFDIHKAQLTMNEGFKTFGDFHLIILSQDAEVIKAEFSNEEYKQQTHILEVSHQEVPSYLSCADFGYNFHLPHGSSTYFSPIKNGEYWACGLPIMLPDGIGDDSDITKDSKLGVVIEHGSAGSAYEEMSKLLDTPVDSLRGAVRDLAIEHRNFGISDKVYKLLFSNR